MHLSSGDEELWSIFFGDVSHRLGAELVVAAAAVARSPSGEDMGLGCGSDCVV
jgi:hypothetical protein